jgi:hypothetical protein
MNAIKKQVYSTYDTNLSTRNVMEMPNRSLFYSSIYGLGNWLQMNAIKKKVYSTYDNNSGTWNVMDMHNRCLFYGSIYGLENWLQKNRDRYQE